MDRSRRQEDSSARLALRCACAIGGSRDTAICARAARTFRSTGARQTSCRSGSVCGCHRTGSDVASAHFRQEQPQQSGLGARRRRVVASPLRRVSGRPSEPGRTTPCGLYAGRRGASVASAGQLHQSTATSSGIQFRILSRPPRWVVAQNASAGAAPTATIVQISYLALDLDMMTRCKNVCVRDSEPFHDACTHPDRGHLPD